MEMRQNCEICQLDLQNDGIAFICTHECTYCEDCTENVKKICPNCNGELVRRPRTNANTVEVCTL